MRLVHSSQCLAATAVRVELKSVFPGIVFMVRSEGFASGNSVDIDYVDGPSVTAVRVVTEKYQYGHFDGMTDLYECSNSRKDLPQVKYVCVSRAFSKLASKKLMLELCGKWGIEPKDDLGASFELNGEWCNFSQLIWKEYHDKEVRL